MVLTGKEIERRIGLGEIVISDFDRSRLNPNSYNLRLSNKLAVYKNYELDCARPNEFETIIIDESGYQLKPGILYLGETMEHTETYTTVPGLEGRSSTGRRGHRNPRFCYLASVEIFGDN